MPSGDAAAFEQLTSKFYTVRRLATGNFWLHSTLKVNSREHLMQLQSLAVHKSLIRSHSVSRLPIAGNPACVQLQASARAGLATRH